MRFQIWGTIYEFDIIYNSLINYCYYYEKIKYFKKCMLIYIVYKTHHIYSREIAINVTLREYTNYDGLVSEC